MTAEIEQDIGGLRDDQFPCLQKRWREGRVLAAGPPCNIGIFGAGFLQSQADKFAAPLYPGPVIELIRHLPRFSLTTAGRRLRDSWCQEIGCIAVTRASRRAPCPEEPPQAASRRGALLSMRESLMASRKFLILRRLRSSCLEGRTDPAALISAGTTTKSGRSSLNPAGG